MKKFNAIILALVLIPAMILSGCGRALADNPGNGAIDAPSAVGGTGGETTNGSSADSSIAQNVNDPSNTISVVSTIFPIYDWTRQILGDGSGSADLTVLMDGRVDLHNFQPSAGDIVRIASCDLFIHVGGESDKWVDSVLAMATNPDMIVINLMELLGDDVKAGGSTEGLHNDDCDDPAHLDEHGHHDDHTLSNDSCSDPEHFDDHGHHDDHAHSHGHNDNQDDCDDLDHYDEHDNHVAHEHHGHGDEHVWLSLRNAAVFSAAIADALSVLDPANAAAFQNNLAVYVEKLSVLDAKYQEALGAASHNTLLFGDRFPFRYLADDYGLRYYAAFPGCSAAAEASFETIVSLSEKLNELRLHTVMVTESADMSIARTIVNNSADRNQQILVLDSMQSVTSGNIAGGAEYLSIMESNLVVLMKALE